MKKNKIIAISALLLCLVGLGLTIQARRRGRRHHRKDSSWFVWPLFTTMAVAAASASESQENQTVRANLNAAINTLNAHEQSMKVIDNGIKESKDRLNNLEDAIDRIR